MPTITVSFVKEKDTKNTVKFEEVPQEGKPKMIGSLYIQKWVVGSATKAKVEVNLE